MILMIDNYDSFTYNVVHLLGDLDVEAHVVRNDKITIEEIAELAPNGIVISPGPGTPNDAGICLEMIQKFSGKIPLFGICLGLQSIGQAFGATITRAPKQLHGKTSLIAQTGHEMFKDIPEEFRATRYHSLVIAPETLPECLEITSKADDGQIMGAAHKTHPTYGVQFHPESIASEYGAQMLKNFIDHTCYQKNQ